MKKHYNIGVIGSGNIGGNLGRHFAITGHRVFFSSRHPETLSNLTQELGDNAQAGTVEEAVSFGEVILLATPYGMLPKIHEKVGNLKGKMLIDATNYYAQRDGTEIKEQMNVQGLKESEWVAHYFKGASVAKAFNTIGAGQLLNGAFQEEGDKNIVPYAAMDSNAKETMENLLVDIGFEGAYIGDLSQTKVMEPNQELYVGFPSRGLVKQFAKG